MQVEGTPMNRNILPKGVLALTISVALCVMPQGAVAQRGGHGSFGGFHGGGVGGFRGGAFGGFHGGGFGGFRGSGFGFRGPGFGGFRGGFGWRGWGYPGFGWGWGINVGFGFPYWGWSYPYYDYSPWWGPYAYSYPYPGPYYDPDPRRDPCDYRYSDRCRDDRGTPENNTKPSDWNPAAKPSNAPALGNSPQSDYRTSVTEDYRLAMHTQGALTGNSVTYADLKTLEVPLQLRPAVRNAVQALRAMPPDARERQLASGRYAGFSPAEKDLLRNLVQAQREQ
jgi:hypothetical protein